MRDKLPHKKIQALASEYVKELQEIAAILRGDKIIDWFDSDKGKHLRIAAGGYGVENGEYSFLTDYSNASAGKFNFSTRLSLILASHASSYAVSFPRFYKWTIGLFI